MRPRRLSLLIRIAPIVMKLFLSAWLWMRVPFLGPCCLLDSHALSTFGVFHEFCQLYATVFKTSQNRPALTKIAHPGEHLVFHPWHGWSHDGSALAIWR